MSEFFNMDGYGGFVWSAYAITIAALAWNVWQARRLLQSAKRAARRRLESGGNS